METRDAPPAATWTIGGRTRAQHANRLDRGLRAIGPRSLASALAVLLLAASPAAARIDPAPQPGAMPDGPASALAIDGDAGYLGGRFLTVGPHTGSGATLRASDGTAIAGLPPVTGGDVAAVAGDGRGGWYVGGSFTAVGATPRHGLAHLLADGRVDRRFDPAPDGPVRALLLQAGTLYVAGTFTSLAGRARAGLGAVRAADGSVLPWRPSVDGSVSVLAGCGGPILLGGDFTGVGGKARRGAAMVDGRSGAPLAFDAHLTGAVDGATVTGRSVYLSGDFDSAGGAARPGLAELSAASGSATAWVPEIGARKPVVAGSRVYGLTAGGVAALDRGSGAVVAERGSRNERPLGPHPDTLAVAGNTVYVGSSDYRGVWEDVPVTLGAYNATTLAGVAWEQAPSATRGGPGGVRTSWGDVQALAVQGGRLFAGGRFDFAGGARRYGAAGIDLRAGAVTPLAIHPGWTYGFDPGAIAAGAGVVATGSNPDYNAGAFSAGDSSLLWRYAPYPGAVASVSALARAGRTLYTAGESVDAAGHRLAARDIRTGASLPWAPPGGEPGSSMEPRVVLVAGDTVYVGGRFEVAGHRNLIAYDATTGAVRAGFAPDPDGPVDALALHGGRLYAGGEFAQAGGGTHRNLAALDVQTGAADPAFSPDPDAPVAALAARGRTVIAGGGFTAIGGAARHNLAALRARDGRARRWAPEPDGPVRALVATPCRVLVAGAFAHIAGEFRVGFAQFGAHLR